MSDIPERGRGRRAPRQADEPGVPPAPGWWQAEDGGWHPPNRPTPPAATATPTPWEAALPAPAPAAGASHRTRNILIVVGVVAVIAIGAMLLMQGGDTFSIEGSITVMEKQEGLEGASCEPTGGYSDISVGTSVRVEDEDGTLLSATELADSEKVDLGVAKACRLNFTVEDIPKGSRLYQIEVSHRGQLSYSYKELRDMKFKVEFTLGDLSDLIK